MDDSTERKALFDRLATSDTSTLRRLAGLLQTRGDGADSGSRYLRYLKIVAESDVAGLRTAERSYGTSWKLRGGVDTFHMLLRKWERIEGRVATTVYAAGSQGGANPYDIFEHIAVDPRADGLLDDVRDLRRYLMLVEAETMARESIEPLLPFTQRETQSNNSDRGFLEHLDTIALTDVATIRDKERAYGNSWKRNGGIGAFMMFARKWDRIMMRVHTRVEGTEETDGAALDNIFEHIVADRRSEGVLCDIRDLRQYLLLVEAEMIARRKVRAGTARDNREGANSS